VKRYRVTWEMPYPFGHPNREYHPVEKEHESLVEAVTQYFTLKDWETTGEEPVRNVVLEEGVIEWTVKPVPDKFLRKL
jgi:hypothetical protein